MKKRLIVLIAATALVVLGAAPAMAEDLAFEFTVETATLNQFNTELTVSGWYLCSGDGFVVEESGIGGEIIQSQKGGKIVVSSGFGFGFGNEGQELVCDGETWQPWHAHADANFEGRSATWKRGRVIVNGGGNLFDGEDNHGDGFLGSLKITR
jgi:hypothetical protein